MKEQNTMSFKPSRGAAIKAAIIRKFKRTSPIRIIVFIIFALWCSTFVFGLGWTFFASISDDTLVMYNYLGFPVGWDFNYWKIAFEAMEITGTPLINMFINSIWFTLGNTVIYMAISIMAGYSLGNFKFKGRGFFVALIVIVLMIPVYGTGASTYLLYNKLGLYDSPLILLVAATMMSSNTLIVMTFFQTLPKAYEEAAQIDGAGYWTIFTKIHIPMIIPALGALSLLIIIGNWNNADTPLFYLPSYPTLATGLYLFEKYIDYTPGGSSAYYAGVIMCAIPPIVLFSIFRERIMSSVTIGGIK